MEKKCQMCGKTFTAGQGNYKYCESCKAKTTPPVTITADGGLTKIDPKAAVNMVAREVKKATIFKTEIVGAHTEEVDMVNHPPHYKLSNGMESIDVIRAVLTPEEYRGWCKGNSLKYQFRAGKKDPMKEKEDYCKAQWFLNELNEVLADEKQD